MNEYAATITPNIITTVKTLVFSIPVYANELTDVLFVLFVLVVFKFVVTFPVLIVFPVEIVFPVLIVLPVVTVFPVVVVFPAVTVFAVFSVVVFAVDVVGFVHPLNASSAETTDTKFAINFHIFYPPNLYKNSLLPYIFYYTTFLFSCQTIFYIIKLHFYYQVITKT